MTLAVGLFLPDPLAAMAIPRLAVSRAATAGRDVAQGAPMVTNDPHLRFATMARSRATVATMNEHSHVAQPGPGMGSRDLAPKARLPRQCVGPNTESAHLGAVLICVDQRESLSAQAAAARSQGPRTSMDGTDALAIYAARAVATTD